MTGKTECSYISHRKKATEEFPSSVIFPVIRFVYIPSLDCQSLAGLKKCFGKELLLSAWSWKMPALIRHCLKENDFISWTAWHEFESKNNGCILNFSETQVPPLFLDIPATAHLLTLSISLMLSFVSAPFCVKHVIFGSPAVRSSRPVVISSYHPVISRVHSCYCTQHQIIWLMNFSVRNNVTMCFVNVLGKFLFKICCFILQVCFHCSS